MNTNIECALYNLEQIEFGKKPLAAKDRLRECLSGLAKGRAVPLVVFKGIVKSNSEPTICGYYQNYIGVVTMELADLGKPNLKVIVPDSELLDARVFSFVQSRQEREGLAVMSKVCKIL